MKKNIVEMSDFAAGWLNLNIYDYRRDAIRKMRVSYVNYFFNDLLWACEFLLSKLEGTYEMEIDQEGFEAYLRFYRHNLKDDSSRFTFEIIEPWFEDEIPYNADSEEWRDWHDQMDSTEPTRLMYNGIEVDEFVENILDLIDRHKTDYNEGFVDCPADEVDEDLLKEVKYSLQFYKRGVIEDEEISDS